MSKFTPYMTLLLLSINAYSHSPDAYDDASRTLTLPSVAVGNTTFSNVAVKLNDFQVLKVDPNAAKTSIDLTKLSIGDGRLSTRPVIGSIWSCQTSFNANAGGAFASGSWIHTDGTYDLTTKPSVDGTVQWSNDFLIS